MLADISSVDAIYIVCGRTDMRKSIDGLCAIIQEQFSMEIDHALFLFCGRRCDRIKAILKEPDGIVMIYKRLTAQGSYRWPRNKSEVRNLTWREFDWLMSGIDIDQQSPTHGSRMDKAVTYIQNRRSYLSTYLEDGRCSFSNNLSENAIRPFTVGRKNWLFCDTPNGAQASAVVYTMVEMAKANGVNVYHYLTYLLEKLTA